MARKMIAVIGGSECDEYAIQLAEKLGEAIAKKGATLICGGRGGVMEASCRGAKKFDGLTVGLLPTLDKKDANAFVDVIIPTGLGYARNFIVAQAGDAVIAIAGSAGT